MYNYEVSSEPINYYTTTFVGKGFSKEFEVTAGVHQGSTLSPLLFIIVLEAFSHEFRAGVPWEDQYADDLVIIADSLEEYVRKLLIWKEAMEKKGLWVNAGKTKVMICGTGLDLLQSSGNTHALSVGAASQLPGKGPTDVDDAPAPAC